MLRNLILLSLCLVLASPVMTAAGEKRTKPKKSEPKELSGMSIVGNDDAPKSLYIVPWKSSDLGASTSLKMTLNDADAPIDPDVFKRELDFYKVRTAGSK